MEDLLTLVSTTASGKTLEARQSNPPVVAHGRLESPDDALACLQSQPDRPTVVKVLRYLSDQADTAGGCYLGNPDSCAADLRNTLVTVTIPNYYRVLEGVPQKHLIRCLTNPSCISTILDRLKRLQRGAKNNGLLSEERDRLPIIEDLLDILEQILKGDLAASQIWHDLGRHAPNDVHKRSIWQHYAILTAGQRILSISAEAEDFLKQGGIARSESWLGNGREYAAWLGRNLAVLLNFGRDNNDEDNGSLAVGEICKKVAISASIDQILEPAVMVALKNESFSVLSKAISHCKPFEQRKLLAGIIAFIEKGFFTSSVGDPEDYPVERSPVISAVAALLRELIYRNETLAESLIGLLTSPSHASFISGLETTRSAIAAIAGLSLIDDDFLMKLLDKGMEAFIDPQFVKNSTNLRQQVLARTLVLTCGYVRRRRPDCLAKKATPGYLNKVMQNWVASSTQGMRFVGMVVATIISRLSDPQGRQLEFEFDAHEEQRVAWYQRLSKVDDQLGDLKVLLLPDPKKPIRNMYQNLEKFPNNTAPTDTTAPNTILNFLDGASEEDDLTPYAKPDSDPEDEADDPELVNRNKPSPPVYIRDLIAGLRDQENHDRHQLALSTAASLIRRKAGFGTEVNEHLAELAMVLTNLNDNLDLPGFSQQRQQALIALLLANPKAMAQWFARSFFSGDFSLSQRIAMLTTLGIGARELAGLRDASTDELIPPTSSFPSAMLPPKLHKIYTMESDPVTQISKKLAKTMLEPMAANAADQLSGPNILKVRTFSSRMEVEKRRSKPIPNALAQIVADNFFFPLTGRWWIAARGATSESVYTSIHLLPPFLNTLALLINASGPNTLALPQMTNELWALLLHVRGIADQDRGVLHALLFALLMLLETNENKARIATENAKELLETQEWAKVVFAGLGAGTEEDDKLRALAAGVVVRCSEVVEEYQRRLAGYMIDY